MSALDDYRQVSDRVPNSLRRVLPLPLRRLIVQLYWRWYDARDFMAEAIGWLPSHGLRLLLYRHVLRISIGQRTSIHRNCRFYRPSGVSIGNHTIINRDVLLDGRTELRIGNNVSISERTAIFTLEHDPNSPAFGEQGAPVRIDDYVFVGAGALILPGRVVGEGAVIGAGAVVTRDITPFTIVAGVPARPIGQRRQDLDYILDYRKFLG